MMELLNRENVDAAFKQIIEQYGADHKYVRQIERGDIGCFYTQPQDDAGNYAPACIVGHIVSRLVPESMPIIGELETRLGSSTGAAALLDGSWHGFADQDGNTPEEAFSRLEDEDDEVFVAAVALAQGIQDGGGTWGEAYQAYTQALGRG